MIHLEEVRSTNSWLLERLAKKEVLADETVVWTSRQTAGRGQIGNSWEAEPDKNLSMSMLLRPEFLPPREQFIISEITAMAVMSTVAYYLPEKNVCIKWPNDIYVGDEKIAGILIENQLQGSLLSYSILGIGLNINQERWLSDAPNPTSIKLQSGKTNAVTDVLERLVQTLHGYYSLLRQSFIEGSANELKAEIHACFVSNLYRREGNFPYVDAETGEKFEACIKDVEPTGQLCLKTTGGDLRRYWFKEIKFVLPCGVTKE
ncbi:MAG: biotin--[acetyl-CoA-carboxylase] ligase [Bacteroidales bacterium]|nr:biotin--[acetyl-CoA-carboxylase] ligase [Bacteroidales bacterium]